MIRASDFIKIGDLWTKNGGLYCSFINTGNSVLNSVLTLETVLQLRDIKHSNNFHYMYMSVC